MEFSETLKAKLAEAETLEDVAKICAEEGFDVTLDDLRAAETSHRDELDENALDNVAGGAFMLGPAVVGLYLIWRTIRKK